MEQSTSEGCQTFDGALAALYASSRIDPEQALRAADSPNNLRLRLERLQRRVNGVGPGVGVQLRLAGEADGRRSGQSALMPAVALEPVRSGQSAPMPAVAPEPHHR